jgi:photosystem II stability/assembly factor-like uncharacterized protein
MLSRHMRYRLLPPALLLLPLAAALSGQQQPPRERSGGNEIGEPPDVALRRLQAFQDMYGPPDDAAASAGQGRGEAGPQRPARPVMVNFGNPPDLRLRALGKPGESIRGTIRRLPTENAPAFPATSLGPTNVAGRTSSLAVDPTNPSIIYRGAAGGGVWKSVNGGTTWTPITDNLGNLSIGAIAVAPSAPATVYVGTGEGVFSVDGIDGIGFIRSSDGGLNWTLPTATTVAKYFDLSVHPTNPKEILAATSNGVQKSVDGGDTWSRTSVDLVATAVARIPGSPRTVLATTWDIASAKRTQTGSVYRSDDGGDTWTKVGGAGVNPFDADTGRMSLAIAPSNVNTVYLLAAAASGDSKSCPQDPVDQRGLYRSTDGGKTWQFRGNPVSGSCPSFTSILGGQGWYATAIVVDRTNADTVYAAGLDLWKSTDGAATWVRKSRWDLAPPNPRYVHADTHELLWAGTKLLIANDGGMEVSTNQASTFSSLNTGIPTRQYYALAMTPASPPFVVGGAQDNGTDLRVGATSAYREVIGGDGFGVAVHPGDANTVYGTVYYSRVFRSSDGGASFDEISPPFDATERRPFITPLTMDPNNPQVLYTGSNFLWRTTNGGDTWAKPSATDIGGGGGRGYLTKIAVAKSDSKQLLTASGTGRISRSSDGGATWSAVSGLPARYASHVEFAPNSAAIFYVSFINTAGARLFRTTDSGASFTQIDAGLPPFPIHVVRVDPIASSTLYVGTDVGLYRSTDSGATWARFGGGLPAVSIWDIAIRQNGSILRVATHGRGLFEVRLRSTAPPPPTPGQKP